VKEIIKCSKCGMHIDEPVNTSPKEREPCPECGSTMRDKAIFLEDRIRIREASRVRGKDALGKRVFDVRVGGNLFRLTGKYNHLERKIDWRNNVYYERIIDGETGNVIAFSRAFR
jgi:hypothetical protein